MCQAHAPNTDNPILWGNTSREGTKKMWNYGGSLMAKRLSSEKVVIVFSDLKKSAFSQV
jgi:hypothetical protein